MRVGDADTHVTVWTVKSVQSFSKGNMSLEGGKGDKMWRRR